MNNTLHIPIKWEQNFWGGDPVTVQFGNKDEDGEFEVEDCNHAGSDTEIETEDYYSTPDHCTSESYTIERCNKCPAWRLHTDNGPQEWLYE